MAIKIRPIALKDTANWRKCYDDVARPRQHVLADKAPPLSELRAALRSSLRTKAPFLVAMNGQQIIGWACCHRPQPRALQHCGEFGLVLLPEYLGTGVDKELATRVLKMSQGKVQSVIFSCLSQNTSMLTLAKSLGFRVCGRFPHYAKMAYGFDDLLILQRQMRRPSKSGQNRKRSLAKKPQAN